MNKNKSARTAKIDTAVLPNATQHPLVKDITENKLATFITTHAVTYITIGTTLLSIAFFILNLLAYTACMGYLSVFSMDIGSVGFSAWHGFSYFLSQTVVLTGFLMVVYHFYQVFELYHKKLAINKGASVGKHFKLFVKILIPGLSIIVCSLLTNFLLCNLTVAPKIAVSTKAKTWFLAALILTGIEFLFTSLMFGAVWLGNEIANRLCHNTVKENSSEFKHARFSVFILSLALISTLTLPMFYLCGVKWAYKCRSFPIIDGQYAVVYQCNDTYWAVSISSDGKNLSLDTTHQKAIPVIGTEVVKKQYNSVNIN